MEGEQGSESTKGFPFEGDRDSESAVVTFILQTDLQLGGYAGGKDTGIRGPLRVWYSHPDIRWWRLEPGHGKGMEWGLKACGRHRDSRLHAYVGEGITKRGAQHGFVDLQIDGAYQVKWSTQEERQFSRCVKRDNEDERKKSLILKLP